MVGTRRVGTIAGVSIDAVRRGPSVSISPGIVAMTCVVRRTDNSGRIHSWQLAFLCLTAFSCADVARALEMRLDRSLARADRSLPVDWYDVQHIGVEGKAWENTVGFYDRLPARAATTVRPAVWSLSRHSAGMCVRFATDASTIHAKWSLISESLALPHMPATGVSGVDLYVRTQSGWRWLATGRPAQQVNTAKLVDGLPREMRTYLLYLPLYNGVSAVEIGLPNEATLWKVLLDQGRQQPLVFWGTSITQGGCASRPGMVHTAILGRRFERSVVNLGFSGNGQLEPEVARLISEIDAAVYVIDCLPNLTGQQVAERIEPVVKILRQARPFTPILLVEDRTYADSFLIESRASRNRVNREALKAAFERLTTAGVPALFYLAGDELLGEDGEDTVDGSHPTDLGFMRQAAALEQALAPILRVTLDTVPIEPTETPAE
jgi:hypothetical protein